MVTIIKISVTICVGYDAVKNVSTLVDPLRSQTPLAESS